MLYCCHKVIMKALSRIFIAKESVCGRLRGNLYVYTLVFRLDME